MNCRLGLSYRARCLRKRAGGANEQRNSVEVGVAHCFQRFLHTPQSCRLLMERLHQPNRITYGSLNSQSALAASRGKSAIIIRLLRNVKETHSLTLLVRSNIVIKQQTIIKLRHGFLAQLIFNALFLGTDPLIL